MKKHNSVKQAVRYALCSGAAVAAIVSLSANAADTPIQEVVVTGSRIAQPNMSTTSPVTQVTAEDIAVQGVTRVEDLINQLPQAFAAQNATVANGSTGTATVDLRGLGSPRTLVLVDGRRMPYGGVTSASAAPDLNMIPAAMVERVEVLTGGASAVYGSDAIGGVVNFIMKKDFEGVQFDAQYGLYQHNNDFNGPGQTKLRDVIAANAQGNPQQFALPKSNVTDGESREFNFVVGASTGDGRGNVTLYGGVRDNKAVLQRDRDYSACSLVANPKTSFACGGSPTSFPGYFYTGGEAFTIDSGTGNTFRPFDENTDLYNFGPTNYYQRPDRRYTMGAVGHYELAEHADVYAQLMYTNYESVAQIAPGGNFFDSNTVNCDNPLLSAQQQATIGCTPAMIAAGDDATLYIARRNVEGGGRQDRFSNSSFRGVVGVKGPIAEYWDYDVYMQYSKGQSAPTTNNYFHKLRIPRSLQVVADPVTGAPVCKSVLDGTDPACVPWNPFQIGGVTPESLGYLQVPGIQRGTIEQEIYSGSVTGDLGGIGLISPAASDSIKMVVGVEHRTDHIDNVTDDALASFLLSGTGGPTIGIAGSTKVLDLFTEINAPLVQDKPFADQLSVELAYRYSDYDDLSTDTYKVGMDWAPIEDVRFRASYQRAIRAANIVELFTAQGFNLFDLPGDPCGADLAGTAAAASDAACLATGVPAGQLRSPSLDSPAGQYNFLQGGNQELTPEKSDTYTYGIVLQPSFLPKLQMSVDYFDIKIDDTISTFGAENTLDACYFQADAAACSRVNRDANGNYWRGDGFIEDLNINIGSLSTKGYDLSVSYSGVELGGFGALNFNLSGTLLKELLTEPGPGIEAVECVGKFSGSTCGTPKPEWRHHFRVGWSSPWSVDVSLTWRYLDAVENINEITNNIDYKLGAQSYFDLAANWSVTEKASIVLGINNVLDDNPPLSSAVGTTGNGNTYPQTYEALGRWIFLRGQVSL
ncbi:TonB-dependent receptor plug domain-containing protein [Povalibacter sp.]|uniref:TonB-dependent receptor plug domain-containing protein n=1 Tax=Povalibacter sp. TaxID=1962978 RepID=UPI002F42FEE7